MKRISIAVATVMAAALLLSGCAGGNATTSNEPSSEAKVKLLEAFTATDEKASKEGMIEESISGIQFFDAATNRTYMEQSDPFSEDDTTMIVVYRDGNTLSTMQSITEQLTAPAAQVTQVGDTFTFPVSGDSMYTFGSTSGGDLTAKIVAKDGIVQSISAENELFRSTVKITIGLSDELKAKIATAISEEELSLKYEQQSQMYEEMPTP